MTDFRDALLAEWQRREPSRAPRPLLPLIGDSFDHREIIAAVDVLLSGRLTMGDKVRQFEQEFARLVGVPYAVMVNSGSSETSPLLPYILSCSIKITGSLSRMDDFSKPFASAGVEGMTTFKPGK